MAKSRRAVAFSYKRVWPMKVFFRFALVVAGVTLISACASTTKGDGAAEGGDEALLSEDSQPSDPTTAQNDSPSQPDATVVPPGDAPAADPLAGLETPPAGTETPLVAAAGDVTAPVVSEAPKNAGSSAGSRDRLPKIPVEAMQKKGKNLNRFYFVRSDDTIEHVSELLYGSPGMAKELQMWNGKKWKPGSVVYYVSPSQPEDKEMRSFFQERSVPAEEYQLADGETLPQVAQAKLGHPGSWKEIAVVNGIASAEKLPAGTRVAVYPKDLAAFAYTTPPGGAVAGNPAESPAPGAEATNAQPTPGMESPQPGGENAVTPSSSTDPMVTETAPTPKKKGGLNLGKLVEQNMFAIVIAGALVVLALLLARVSRKRKASGGDFGEEGFAKAKRK